MNGILNVNKPSGLTSHDVVKRIRKLAGGRVGHAGTLDPNATGVLLICGGRATRVAEYLMASEKVYDAVVRLGTETDTYDVDGRVVETRRVSVSRAEIEAALEGFRGEIEQVPPAYSALKRNGQPLYKLARRGIEVERSARHVEISELTLIECKIPDVTLRIRCSPGTYVRSLAHDLGRVLGCGAHLASLERTASGNFTSADAIALDDAEAAASEARLVELLQPLDAALGMYPSATLNEQEVADVRCGRMLSHEIAPADPEGLCCAYDRDGELVAIIRFDARKRRWCPHKVFADRS